MRSLRAIVGAAATSGFLGLFAVGCSTPEPPTLTPKSAKVTAVTIVGLNLDLDVEAYNPNKMDLSARTVTAKVVLDGKYDLGTTTMTRAITIPAGAHTDLDVPLSLTWKDVSALATMSATNRPIPFTVDGTVTVGGDRLNIDLPIHMTGALTHDELLQATMRSVGGGVPGFRLPH